MLLKSKILFCLFISFTALSCEKDTQVILIQNSNDSGSNDAISLQYENKSLVLNFCGVYCPPCGTWGWNWFDTLMKRHPDDALFMMIYASNPYNTGEQGALVLSQTAETIEENVGVNSYPTFGVNHEPKYDRNNNVNIQSEIRMIESEIARHSEDFFEALIGLNFKINPNNHEITFSYSALIESPSKDANYKLAIYLLEDHVKAYQAGHPAGVDALHPMVLRKGYKDAWGFDLELDNSGSAKGSGSMVYDPDWDTQNFHLYGVIYDTENEPFEYAKPVRFVNAVEGKLTP